jgi:hypothetical protein
MFKVYESTVKISSRYDQLLEENRSLSRIDKSTIIKRNSGEFNPFDVKEIGWNKKELDKATCGANLYSPHVYTDGHRIGAKWQATQLLVFDFDNKGEEIPSTPDQIADRVDKNTTYYIHYSRSHDPDNGQIKFHAHFVLDRQIADPQHYDLIYKHMRSELFPESDSIGDRGRCIIPGRSDFDSIFRSGVPLNVDQLLESAQKAKMKTQSVKLTESLKAVSKANKRPSAKTKPVYLPLDTIVQREDGSFASIRQLDPQDNEQFLCPHCGDKPGRGNPGKANATYQLNSQGLPIVYCSSCDATGQGGTSLKGVYNIQPEEVYEVVRERICDKYENFFFLEDRLAKVYIQKEVEPFSIALGKVSPRAINEPPAVKEAFLAELAQQGRSVSELRFNQESDMDAVVPTYTWQGDKLIARNPALLPKVEDNAMIEDWLYSLFGKHTGFVKQWLAMFCYTNNQATPVLILYSKQRGTGKNVFAEAICSIFENLHSRDTDYKQFTEAFKCKLWYIDEQSTDGKALYQVVKQISGNNVLVVNNKFGLKYQVDRNLSVILTTNNLKPMEMEADELQIDDTNNQFFVYEMKPIDPKNRRNDIQNKIKERLGHYIRTELKEVYAQIQADSNSAVYRYGIRVPITEEEKRLYGLSKSTLECEGEEVWACMQTREYPILDNLELSSGILDYRFHEDAAYVMASELRKMTKQMRCDSSSAKIINYLQQKDYLGFDIERIKGQRLGYRLNLVTEMVTKLRQKVTFSLK